MLRLFWRRRKLRTKVTRPMFENLLRMIPNKVVANENFMGIYYDRPNEGLDEVVILNGDYRSLVLDDYDAAENVLNLERMRIKFEW